MIFTRPLLIAIVLFLILSGCQSETTSETSLPEASLNTETSEQSVNSPVDGESNNQEANPILEAEDGRSPDTICSFINGSQVNIRSGPGQEYEVVTQLNRGDGVRAVGQEGDWVQLTAQVYGFPPDERMEPLEGWVFNQYINGCSEDQFDRWRSTSRTISDSAFSAPSGNLQQILDNYITGRESPESGYEYEDARTLVYGDIDSDGDEDAVVTYTLAGAGGGNSFAQNLAVFRNTEGQFEFLADEVVGGKFYQSFSLERVESGRIFGTTETCINTPQGLCEDPLIDQVSFVISGNELQEE